MKVSLPKAAPLLKHLLCTSTVRFAVLVLTPDDLVRGRKIGTFGPRDNVVFELGLFMGRLVGSVPFLYIKLTQSGGFPLIYPASPQQRMSGLATMEATWAQLGQLAIASGN
jgi:hypothetical protein